MTDLTNIFRRVRRGAIAAAAALALGACGSLVDLGGPPSTFYGLDAPDDFSPGFESGDWQLIVEEPVAERALDSDRIAIFTDGHALQYYADARWTDRAPRLVQNLLIESYENAGLGLSVGRHSISMNPDYALLSEMRSFEARLSGPETAPVIYVRLSAKLVSLPRREIIDGRSFSAKAEASGTDISSVVRAFNAAAGEAVHDMVSWSAATIEASRDKKNTSRR